MTGLHHGIGRGLGATIFACGTLVAAVAAPLVTGCSSNAQTSDTKTNWFRSCESDDDCGPHSCLCGLCTQDCTTSDQCESGTCDESLASEVQCDGVPQSLRAEVGLCLPEPAASCTEAPLARDADLGAALAPECGAPGALICEGFDRPFPPEYSTFQDLGGAASLQDCVVYSGKGAARYTGSDEAFTQTRMRLPSPVSDGALHARFFTRITAESELAEWQILFEYWHSEAGGDAEPTTLYLTEDGRLQLYNGATDTVLDANGMAPLERESWHCIEIGLVLSETAGSVTLSVADAPVFEQTGIDTVAVEPFLMAVIESKRAPGSPEGEVELFVDDLIVATEPIGCD